ncbi:D-alanine--D-alanine ligase [bacterium BMS3Bbin12]|nr:D-alanine--D-alanine ligase [bacterium BMS3Abin12]GBE48530.1 D-alanine--D-alanine ligase [bacterium BMS3Bbin12]GBE51517.1 D-alanine--D-alanine ligase [bacterium BMS3Bbin13]HDJ85762.1 D-alanine--D-alanine ligase [Chromatiales bacterium]HDO33979.1 D-alanine--D-alanine ligase [Chromatiales bacterium]
MNVGVSDRSRPAADCGKVAVLMGGRSAEREISLCTGAAVLAALQRRGVDAHAVDPAEYTVARLPEDGFRRAFIALHGRGGEDGVIQGALETLGLAYTGSGVLGSALALDKLRGKQVWIGAGIPTPAFEVLGAESDFAAIAHRLGLPLIVKPALEGSSLGMTKVERAGDLEAAYAEAARFDRCVLAERWIRGSEYTAAILGERVLPLIRVETPRAFYDYEAKYRADSTRYHCPCGLTGGREEAFARRAWEAFQALGASGWGRVDFLIDEEGAPTFIEVNTVPGMTDHSLVPMAARAAGIDFDELVLGVLATSFADAGAVAGRIPWPA